METGMFSITNLPATLRYQVDLLEWRALGGPRLARLRADGPEGDLARLVSALGGPLTLHDARGAAWWGYLSCLTLHTRRFALRMDLEELGNRVAILYRDVAREISGGSRRQTDWVEDADSIAR